MIEPDEDKCLCCGGEIIINEDGDDWCICLDDLCDNCNGEVSF